MSERFLLDLQLDVAARAQADAVLSAVRVTHQRKGNIEQFVAESTGLVSEVDGKIGVCILVLAPIGEVEFPSAPGGPLVSDVVFRVLEEPTLNNDAAKGTLISAEEICYRLKTIFHGYQPGGLATTLMAKKPTIVPIEDPMASVAYEVRFETSEAEIGEYEKVLTPTISPSGGAAPQEVTLACDTAGAAIYYTLNGTHPSPANGLLYLAPFDVEAAALLRVAAFKADYVGSDTVGARFT